MKLIKDKMSIIQRDEEDGCMIPLTTVVTNDERNSRVVQYGQHDKFNRINGIGRIMRIHRNGEDIWEGEFINN